MRNQPKTRARTQIGTMRDQMAVLEKRVQHLEKHLPVVWVMLAGTMILLGLVTAYVLWVK